jgi:hypothetical protein
MWLNLLIELVGSLVGAGLGVWFAMWQDRVRERQSTQGRRIDIVTTLIHEIDRTITAVDEYELEQGEPTATGAVGVSLSYPYLLDAAFRATVASGGLALLSGNQQIDLAQYYRSVDLANGLLSRIATQAPDLDQSNMWLFKNMYTHLNSHLQMLKVLGEPLLKELRTIVPVEN